MDDDFKVILGGLLIAAIILVPLYFITGGWSSQTFYENNTKACANYWKWFTFHDKIKQVCWKLEEIK